MLRQFPHFIALAAILVLGGCYEVETPVLVKGDKAPIVGSYTCQTMTRTARLTVTEASSGLFFKDYRYSDGGGNRITLRSLSPDYYLAQIEVPDKPIMVGYLDTSNPAKPRVFGANIYTGPNPIPTMAREHQVQARESTGNLVRLPLVVRLSSCRHSSTSIRRDTLRC